MALWRPLSVPRCCVRCCEALSATVWCCVLVLCGGYVVLSGAEWCCVETLRWCHVAMGGAVRCWVSVSSGVGLWCCVVVSVWPVVLPPVLVLPVLLVRVVVLECYAVWC